MGWTQKVTCISPGVVSTKSLKGSHPYPLSAVMMLMHWLLTLLCVALLCVLQVTIRIPQRQPPVAPPTAAALNAGGCRPCHSGLRLAQLLCCNSRHLAGCCSRAWLCQPLYISVFSRFRPEPPLQEWQVCKGLCISACQAQHGESSPLFSTDCLAANCLNDCHMTGCSSSAACGNVNSRLTAGHLQSSAECTTALCDWLLDSSACWQWCQLACWFIK